MDESAKLLEDRVLPSLESPIRYSSLCQAYDTLMDALVREQDLLAPSNRKDTAPSDDKDGLISNELSNTEHLSTTTKLKSIVIRQADHLRALQLICKMLIGILDLSSVPTKATSDDLANAATTKDKRTVLEQTIQRCGILLESLASWQGTTTDVDATGIAVGTSEPSNFRKSHLPESHHSILRGDYFHQDTEPHVVPHKTLPGLYIYISTNENTSFDEKEANGNSSNDEEDDNLLTWDSATLEQEEQDLIRMATTPIPGEALPATG